MTVAQIRVEQGDMREVLAGMVARGERVQAVVTDPPYGLEFMGRKWDAEANVAFQPETWRLCWELLPPGGHLLAFGGTRRFHRLVCAIEDAGFEIRDTIAWIYGSGFPKSRDVSKAIDSEAGVEREVIGKDANYGAAARQWQGWGTALKPAMELICVARKPLVGTVAANVLKHGVGGLNVDACRIGTNGETISAGHADSIRRGNFQEHEGWDRPWKRDVDEHAARRDAAIERANSLGRWPANLCHDGSAEVVAMFPDSVSQPDGNRGTSQIWGGANGSQDRNGFSDSGSAARFFFNSRAGDEKRFHYGSKADASDRLQSVHPTVKPVDLLRWLVRLVCPPGGTVLDPFAGSGTTGMACMAEGFDCVLVEREAEHVADIRRRSAHVHGDDLPLFAQAAD